MRQSRSPGATLKALISEARAISPGSRLTRRRRLQLELATLAAVEEGEEGGGDEYEQEVEAVL